jgi:hypothetical protein
LEPTLGTILQLLKQQTYNKEGERLDDKKSETLKLAEQTTKQAEQTTKQAEHTTGGIMHINIKFVEKTYTVGVCVESILRLREVCIGFQSAQDRFLC